VAEPLLLVEQARERSPQDRLRDDAAPHCLGEAAPRGPARGRGDACRVARARGAAGDRVAERVGAGAAGRVVAARGRDAEEVGAGLHVQALQDGAGAVLAAVVRAHEGRRAPQVPQHVGEEPGVLGREVPLVEGPAAGGGVRPRSEGARRPGAPEVHLEELVGRHQRGGPGLLHTGLEGRQEELVHRLVRHRDVAQFVGAAVRPEVLQLRHEPHALHAVDLGRGQRSAQERILARARVDRAPPVHERAHVGLRPEEPGHHQLPALPSLHLAPGVGVGAVEARREPHELHGCGGLAGGEEPVDALRVHPAEGHDGGRRPHRRAVYARAVASGARTAGEQDHGAVDLRGGGVRWQELLEQAHHGAGVGRLRSHGGRAHLRGERHRQRVGRVAGQRRGRVAGRRGRLTARGAGRGQGEDDEEERGHDAPARLRARAPAAETRIGSGGQVRRP